MGRDYINWYNKRGSSSNRLEERPHITNTVNGEKRYYSSIDAEIYLADIFIDEVTSIQWTVQQQAMPIYGYNSYTFDDIAVGARLVQGQFSVNFTQAGFLKQLQDDPSFASMARTLYGPDNKAESYFTQEYRRRLNTPMWDKGFDIVVGFGDHNKSINSLANNMYKTYAVLDCCQITGSMVQLDYNGEPVQEVYTFIARDIKYNTATTAERNPSEDNGTNDTNTVERPTKNTYVGTIDLTTQEGSIKIFSEQTTKLQSAIITVIDDVEDKSLKNQLELSVMPGGELRRSLNRDQTKKFKTECTKNNYSSITVQAMIKYYGPSNTSTETGVKTDKETLKLTVKM